MMRIVRAVRALLDKRQYQERRRGLDSMNVPPPKGIQQ
jgi:hypothetical protein